MNVVSLMAHQDDEMFCLGTMLKCRARGDMLCFVTVTDGSKGFVQNPGISREEATHIRRTEMQSLADAAGADYIHLDEQDEFLYDTPVVRMAVIEAIRRSRADIIFTHFEQDYNLDHITVSSLVRHCAMQACLPVLPTASAPLAQPPAIFMVEPGGPFAFTPSHYVDITAHHAEKAALLSHHASQNVAMSQAAGVRSSLEELSARVASFRGWQVGCQYAEAFVPMPARGALKAGPLLP
jgi:LmbE family N-acetylglucosaminyl deacetylase